MGKGHATLMTDQDRDNILLLLEKGLEPNQIGPMFGRSTSAVNHLRRVYEACKNGDLENAKRIAMTSNNTSLFRWACRKTGRDPDAEETPKEETPDAPRVADNSELIDAVLALTNKHDLAIESLIKKMDQLAVIIQSCAKGVQQTINANADIMHREQLTHREALNGIKSNTRRRIDQGG